VHEGVLQVVTAGAGTAHRMPEGIEYLHCVQLALDARGVRYQVLDTAGCIREWLAWPLALPPAASWTALASGSDAAPIFEDYAGDTPTARVVLWQFSGVCAAASDGSAQTLLSGWSPGPALAPLWIGLRGREHHLSVLLSPSPGRSPHLWQGPSLSPGAPFSLQVAVHTGMGPGGLLWRWNDATPWSSLTAASPWGAERLTWPANWSIGHGQRGPADRPFRGDDLQVRWQTQVVDWA
jgi:hypothetical protein